MKLSDAEKQMIGVIKKALWNTGPAHADEATFEEMRNHAIAGLAAPVLSELSLTPELAKAWEKEALRTIANNYRCLYIQNGLPVDVPYAVLKGTSAAQYYPHPDCRQMGDIDIMTSHEDFERACSLLKENGYQDENDKYIGPIRHREYSKNNVEIEVHLYYAYRNDPEEARILDDLIIENIREDHTLPDIINGLTLIEHINFHMEYGLGLRQIIDWMLFVDRCLPDEKWPEFRELARKTGHEKLAEITTRMCEIYLGLPEHRWCAGADPEVCEKLFAFLLSCGNFGVKLEQESKASTRFLTNIRSIPGVMRYLQKQGTLSWKAVQKYRVLRPFAWAHQAMRYLTKGISRDGTLGKLKKEYEESKERNELFDALGVTREQKGLVVFHDGRYVMK